jgi:hypothetical protein
VQLSISRPHRVDEASLHAGAPPFQMLMRKDREHQPDNANY